MGKETWRTCFTLFLPERLEAGTLLMCKAYLAGNEVIIFDGNIIWSSENKGHKGYETDIGLVTISERDKDKLKEVIHK